MAGFLGNKPADQPLTTLPDGIVTNDDLAGSITDSKISALAASKLTGTIADARFPATLPAASGVNLTALNATNIGSGTVPTARLGTGTASSSTFLRGDQTCAAISAIDYTQTSDPLVSTNPSSLGATWINTTSGEIFVCKDITTGENEWLGTAGTLVKPITYFGGRGLIQGYKAGPTYTIDYVTISTPGNAVDFGDLSVPRASMGSCSNGTRGLFGGDSTVIDYVTIATSGGTATDFGDLTVGRNLLAACSDGTKGVWGGGDAGSSYSNVLDYVIIETPANATDFGDLGYTRGYLGACSNGTRGVWAGGYNGSNLNAMGYVTIATPSNSTDFGDLTVARRNLAACGDGTKGVWGGGHTSGSVNTMDYVNVATTGNATDFGDLSVARSALGSCSDGTKGLWAGGTTSDVIDYVTLSTTSNAVDFGNLVANKQAATATSGD